MAENTIVTLKKGEGRTLKAGGMWVYDNELQVLPVILKMATLFPYTISTAISWAMAF